MVGSLSFRVWLKAIRHAIKAVESAVSAKSHETFLEEN
jgi:hypothetical protein